MGWIHEGRLACMWDAHIGAYASHACVCACGCQKSTIPEEPATLFLPFFCFVCFEMDSFTGTWSPLGRLSRVAREFQESPDPALSILESEERPVIPDFLPGCWESNSSSHAYIPTELSPRQSHVICLLQAILDVCIYLFIWGWTTAHLWRSAL